MALSITGSNVSGGMNYTVIPAAQGSVSFNGLNQSLIYNYTSQFDLSTGNPNFTIECWFYPRAITAGMILNNGGIVSYSYSQYQIYLDSSGLLYASLGRAGGAGGAYGDTYIGITTTPITINNWYHVALVRNGNYASVFLNGVVFGSVYLGTSFYPGSFESSGSPLYIGSVLGDNFSTPTAFFYGYISNVRLIKNTAAYNPGFTTPTTPLAAVTGTSLLLDATSSATYLTDSSTNNYTVTNNNGVTYSSSSPISLGGSLSFNNSSSQYLSIAGTLGGPLDLATGAPNWTIECWVYLNSTSVQNLVLCNGGQIYIANASYTYYITPGGQSYWIVGDGGGGGSQQSGGILSINTWYHVAMVRNGNTLNTYLNGNLVTTVVMGFTMANAYNYNLTIGSDRAASATNYYNGYITNLRIVKGYALYTSNFIPPNSPFSTIQIPNTNGYPSSQISASQTGFLLNTSNNASYLSNGSLYTITGGQSTTATGYLPSLIPAITSTSLSPFPGSVRFNGTSQSLTAPSNAAFGYTTGTDFTIEMWIYVTAINGAANMYLLDSRPASTQGLYTTLFINTTGNIVYYTNSANRITSSSTVSVNTWYHVALVRLSGTTTLYLNGTPTGSTYADTNTYVASAQQIAASYNAGAALTTFYNGYISSLRIVKGVGVYSTTFTPADGIFLSTQPPNQFSNPSLAITGTQTSLLLKTTYDTNFLVDYSTNALTITNTGTATSSALNPFNGNYAIANTPGSVQFNGSSQALSIANNAAFAFGSGDLTVECWFYQTSFGATSLALVALYKLATGRAWILYTTTAGAVAVTLGGGTGLSGGTISLNTWNHVAWTRNGANFYLYLNGIQVATVAASTIIASTDPLFIGANNDSASPTWFFPGYISNVRVVKGLAVYTGAFSPSTTPLTAVTNTQLLVDVASSGAYLTDGSNNNFTLTPTGNVTYNSSTPVSSGGSLYFDQSTISYLTLPSSTAFNLTGDFTIQAWVNPTTILAGNNGILDARVNGQTAAPWVFYIDGAGKISFFTGSYYTGATTISTGVWTHVAAQRSGSILTLYVNGVPDYSANIGTGAISPGTTTAVIGTKDYGINAQFRTINYITNLQFVNGTALFNGSFVPPAGPLQASQAANQSGSLSAAVTSAQTSLLLNTAYGTSFTQDSSVNNFTVTNVGTATSNTRYPFVF